jgi:hypothetical protein
MASKRPKAGLAEPRDPAAGDAPAPRPLPEPIGTVRRTLVRPDGTKISVDVPVYPPFRLESEPAATPSKPPRRSRPAKPRPTGSD